MYASSLVYSVHYIPFGWCTRRVRLFKSSYRVCVPVRNW